MKIEQKIENQDRRKCKRRNERRRRMKRRRKEEGKWTSINSGDENFQSFPINFRKGPDQTLHLSSSASPNHPPSLSPSHPLRQPLSSPSHLFIYHPLILLINSFKKILMVVRPHPLPHPPFFSSPLVIHHSSRSSWSFILIHSIILPPSPPTSSSTSQPSHQFLHPDPHCLSSSFSFFIHLPPHP